jgi:hypothetical protein
LRGGAVDSIANRVNQGVAMHSIGFSPGASG